jgi:hypothetical protein
MEYFATRDSSQSAVLVDVTARAGGADIASKTPLREDNKTGSENNEIVENKMVGRK